MSDRINRRDQILDSASRLFIEQGYSATSVRQIADDVGCTEAAIYYHFKDGKRALFQAVVEENLPDMMELIEQCRPAESLHDLILRFGAAMADSVDRQPVERFRWLIAEYPNLSDDERTLFHHKYLQFHEALAELVDQFVAGDAGRIAWTMICAAFGYGQLFRNLGMRTVTDFAPEDLMAVLADALADE